MLLVIARRQQIHNRLHVHYVPVRFHVLYRRPHCILAEAHLSNIFHNALLLRHRPLRHLLLRLRRDLRRWRRWRRRLRITRICSASLCMVVAKVLLRLFLLRLRKAWQLLLVEMILRLLWSLLRLLRHMVGWIYISVLRRVLMLRLISRTGLGLWLWR